MITITERAGNHLKSLVKDTNNVEFSVDGGGCSGMNYNLKFTRTTEPQPPSQPWLYSEQQSGKEIEKGFASGFFQAILYLCYNNRFTVGGPR